ncbi:hypothetical protein FHG87_006839 [Trinorchestia longiramus]|nr:hypothetical protein FHG87_006839 [Trinorchestia longiramus]
MFLSILYLERGLVFLSYGRSIGRDPDGERHELLRCAVQRCCTGAATDAAVVAAAVISLVALRLSGEMDPDDAKFLILLIRSLTCNTPGVDGSEVCEDSSNGPKHSPSSPTRVQVSSEIPPDITPPKVGQEDASHLATSSSKMSPCGSSQATSEVSSIVSSHVTREDLPQVSRNTSLETAPTNMPEESCLKVSDDVSFEKSVNAHGQVLPKTSTVHSNLHEKENNSFRGSPKMIQQNIQSVNSGIGILLENSTARITTLMDHPAFSSLQESLASERRQWEAAVLVSRLNGGDKLPTSGAGNAWSANSACASSTDDDDVLSELVVTAAPAFWRAGRQRGLLQVVTSLLPLPWSSLSLVRQLLLVLAINPSQCHEVLEALTKWKFPGTKLDSFSAVSYARDYLKIPTVLHTKQKLELPKRPLLVVANHMNAVCEPHLIWQHCEPGTSVTSLLLLEQNGSLEARVQESMRAGKLLVLQAAHRCSQASQAALCTQLHRFNDALRSGTAMLRCGQEAGDAPYRFRLVFVVPSIAQMSPALLSLCTFVWLQDTPSGEVVFRPPVKEALMPLVKGALVPSVAFCGHIWTCSVQESLGLPVARVLLCVSALHAALWAFPPHCGRRRLLLDSGDLVLVLELIRVSGGLIWELDT